MLAAADATAGSDLAMARAEEPSEELIHTEDPIHTADAVSFGEALGETTALQEPGDLAMAWSDDVFASPDSTDLHEPDACLSARVDALQPVFPADVTSGDGSDSLRRQDLDAARIGREELPELAVADRSMPMDEIPRDRSRSPAAPRTAT